MTRISARLLLALPLLVAAAAASAFDHTHEAWTEILARHQSWSSDGKRSHFAYEAARADRAAIEAYVEELGAVSAEAFESCNRDQQLAFLMNLYNAAAIQLILTEDELPESIRDLGSLFRPVWKKKFFTLFGEPTSLDHVEHGILRERYDVPLIHAGLVCASCSCPPLRDEAYEGDRVIEQLRDTMRRFLSDRGRNRVAADERRVEISKIFDWFAADFEDERGDIRPYLAEWSAALADSPAGATLLTGKDYRISHLDYDWGLNAPGNCPDA